MGRHFLAGRRFLALILASALFAAACSRVDEAAPPLDVVGPADVRSDAAGGKGVGVSGAADVVGVGAFGDSGSGQESAPDPVSVELDELPDAVVVAASGGVIRLSWPRGEPVGGSSVAGYEVRWKSGDQTWDAQRRAVVVGLSYTIGGLEDATVYTVRVRAAPVETSNAGEASISMGAGAEPTAEIVEDVPESSGSELVAVSALSGAVRFEAAGEPVWPATLVVPVDMARIADDSYVQLAYYDEDGGSWILVPGSVFDRGLGIVTAEVYHLSLWSPVCVVGPFNLCTEAAPPTPGIVEQIGDFLGDQWEEIRDWLSDGWETARGFVVEDVFGRGPESSDGPTGQAEGPSFDLQALLQGVSALAGGTSTIVGTVTELLPIIQCVWGVFSNNTDGWMSALNELLESSAADCLLPHMSDLLASGALQFFFPTYKVFVLLYEYAQTFLGGTP